MTYSSDFQITSIEPTQTFAAMVSQIAQRHELSVKFAEPSNFSAPFCGSTYYVQPMTLHQSATETTLSNMKNCLDEIAKMVERQLADGFFESS